MDKMKMLLFCLPFGGGSANYFLPLAPFLPPWMQLVPVERPGRGSRSEEPLLTDFEELADDATEQIRSRLAHEALPFALFGHCMGGMLAYIISHRLQTPPCHLFLSSPVILPLEGIGFKPDDFLLQHRIAELSPNDLLNYLRRIGRLTDEMLASRELLDYAVPVLRADFIALESWRTPVLPPLSLPVSVFQGSEEKQHPYWYWAARTSGAFNLRTFEGGHFHLADHWQAIADAISHDIEKGTNPRLTDGMPDNAVS